MNHRKRVTKSLAVRNLLGLVPIVGPKGSSMESTKKGTAEVSTTIIIIRKTNAWPVITTRALAP